MAGCVRDVQICVPHSPNDAHRGDKRLSRAVAWQQKQRLTVEGGIHVGSAYRLEGLGGGGLGVPVVS